MKPFVRGVNKSSSVVIMAEALLICCSASPLFPSVDVVRHKLEVLMNSARRELEWNVGPESGIAAMLKSKWSFPGRASVWSIWWMKSLQSIQCGLGVDGVQRSCRFPRQ